MVSKSELASVLGVNTKPVSCSIVKVVPALTTSPLAVVITPPSGTESTLIVRISSVSSSVGADILRGLSVLSSSIVTVESGAATGIRFDDPLHAEIVIEASDGKSIDLTPEFRLYRLLIRRCFSKS